MDVRELTDYVIQLHDIARNIQRVVGGDTDLVKAIRKNADDLAEAIDALSRL